MAKMFYSLDEAAQTLGMTTDQVKQIASDGKLQQFRDRDKLMFKREEVDALASNEGSASDSEIPLADTGETDAVNLKEQTGGPANPPQDSNAGETGISVFETDEVEHADPMAQTQVTQSSSGDTQSVSDEDDLALESVGSGSGLLDLTRASDDTSLGAELDDIYPGGGSEAGGTNAGSAAGASGVSDSAADMETATSGPSGLENLGEAEPESEPAAPRAAGPTVAATYQSADEGDPIWSGLGAGLLLGAGIALVLGLIVAISTLSGVTSGVTTTMTGFGVGYSALVLLVICAILGIIGALIGKAAA